MEYDYNQQAAGYHGVKNAKYAVKGEQEVYATPASFAYAKAISLDPKLETETNFANNMAIFSAVSDQGYGGSFGTTAQNRAFEKDLGMLMDVAGGTADVNLLSLKRFALYYEHGEKLPGGRTYTVKVWLLNCEATKASKNHETDTTKPTFGAYAYPLTIYGEKIKAADSSNIYTDPDGNEYIATRIIALPTDEGYGTFGNAVPTPKIPTPATPPNGDPLALNENLPQPILEEGTKTRSVRG